MARRPEQLPLRQSIPTLKNQLFFLAIAVTGLFDTPSSLFTIEFGAACTIIASGFFAYRVLFYQLERRLKFGILALVIFAIQALVDFAAIYRKTGLLEGTTAVSDAWSCLYFSIITWTSVGFGDLVPSHASRVFAASEALFAYALWPFLIAAILTFTNSER